MPEPSTVEVRVTERVPTAIARQGDQLSLVDSTGQVIDAFGAVEDVTERAISALEPFADS